LLEEARALDNSRQIIEKSESPAPPNKPTPTSKENHEVIYDDEENRELFLDYLV
jgi:hypothetical protein